MNRNLKQCITSSLGVSGERESFFVSLGTFTDRDWRRTLRWLDESGLGLYLLKRLSDCVALQVLPAAVLTRLQQDLDTNRCRLSIMTQEFSTLLRAFDAAGVQFAVLKGFALVPEYCPDAALRSQFDYDFLVHPVSARAAYEVLVSQGYSVKHKSPGFEKDDESLFTAHPLSIPSRDLGFHSPEIPREVEVHLKLWEPNRDMIGVETPVDVLNRTRLSKWQGLVFPALEADDSLMFQVLHAFRHMLDYWCRPSCFLEIAHFIAGRQHDAAFWNGFRERVEGHRFLSEIIGLVFSMAEMLFAAPIPPEAAAWTTQALPETMTLWVRQYGREWALASFPGSKLSLFVHKFFIQEPQTWKEVSRGRLFPFHRSAKVAESVDRGLPSHFHAQWQQACYFLSRLKFHLVGVLSYARTQRAWKQKLRSLG